MSDSEYEECDSEYEECDSGGCPHDNKDVDGDYVFCADCGEQLFKQADFSQEWRYYGHKDNKHSRNPARTTSSVRDEKNIKRDVEGLDLPADIVNEADILYKKVTENRIYRGANRKAIIYACVFHAYKNSGQPVDSNGLRTVFNMSRKAISSGLRVYNKAMKHCKEKTYIRPVDLIPNILKELNADQSHIDNAVRLFERVIANSKMIDKRDKKLATAAKKITTSNPQSIATGLTYYYCHLMGKDIPKDRFSKVANLSIATIIKMAKEIALIDGRGVSL